MTSTGQTAHDTAAESADGIPAGTYTVDPTHSRVGFVARHAMVSKVRGSFGTFTGQGRFDSDDPSASSLALTVQAASIDTGNADRDAHLRSNDFFAMDQFPEITFTSTAVAAVGEAAYEVTGELTIRGVTRSVTVELEHTGTVVDPWQNQRVGLEGRTTVNRKDFGVSWNAGLDAGGVLVGDKVTLELDISAVRDPQG